MRIISTDGTISFQISNYRKEYGIIDEAIDLILSRDEIIEFLSELSTIASEQPERVIDLQLNKYSESYGDVISVKLENTRELILSTLSENSLIWFDDKLVKFAEKKFNNLDKSELDNIAKQVMNYLIDEKLLGDNFEKLEDVSMKGDHFYLDGYDLSLSYIRINKEFYQFKLSIFEPSCSFCDKHICLDFKINFFEPITRNIVNNYLLEKLTYLIKEYAKANLKSVIKNVDSLTIYVKTITDEFGKVIKEENFRGDKLYIHIDKNTGKSGEPIISIYYRAMHMQNKLEHVYSCITGLLLLDKLKEDAE